MWSTWISHRNYLLKMTSNFDEVLFGSTQYAQRDYVYHHRVPPRNEWPGEDILLCSSTVIALSHVKISNGLGRRFVATYKHIRLASTQNYQNVSVHHGAHTNPIPELIPSYRNVSNYCQMTTLHSWRTPDQI